MHIVNDSSNDYLSSIQILKYEVVAWERRYMTNLISLSGLKNLLGKIIIF